ncbi:MAG: helix-turn-helix transcriptional regulator [Bacteroidota bacterium]
MFSYREYQVELLLQKYIRKVWVLDNLRNPRVLSGKQLLPNGCFNLAFIFGNGVRVAQKSQEELLSEGIYLCGQFTQHVPLRVLAHTKVTLAQLHAWTPSTLACFPLHEIKNRVRPFAHLNPDLRNHLIEIDLEDEAVIMRFLSDSVAPRIRESTKTGLIRQTFLQFKYDRGDTRIQDLSESSGISRRSLEHNFKTGLGITPKELATIIKVRSLVDELKKSPTLRPNLTTLAHQYGFYDQAHFIRVFRQITSISPKAFEADNYFLPQQGKGL